MKRYIHSAIILLAALSLAGCSKTEEFRHNAANALEIASVRGISPFVPMQEPASKAVITGETLSGDEASKGIGLFVTATDGTAYDGKSEGYSNVKYNYNGEKWSAASPIYLSNTSGKLYAYFPYSADATDLTAIPVESSLNSTDYLYATSQDVSFSNKSVNLQMNHALARLHLTVKKGDKYLSDCNLSKIVLQSKAIDASGTMNITTGAVTATKVANEIGTFTLTGTDAVTAAGITKDILLVPASAAEGKKDLILSLTIDGVDAEVKFTGDKGLDIRSGIQNNVTLTIEDTGIKVTGVGVGVWGDGGSQTVQVDGHTVTVKLDEDVTSHDVLAEMYVEGDDVIIKACSETGERLKCTLLGGDLCPQSKTDKLCYTFTLSDIISDVIATIGYAKPVTISKIPSNNTDWGRATFNGECFEGERITFIASAQSGCKFVEWQDAEGKKLDWDNPQDITLTSNLSVKAAFENPHGAFSISNDGGTTTKQILFSRGNLWYGKVEGAETATFNFEKQQYEYHTYDSESNTWGLFGWSTNSNNYGVSTSTSSSIYSGDFRDWGIAIDGIGITWRTLSRSEWEYLFNGRTNAEDKYGYASVNNVHGIIILPDTFTDPKKNNGSVAFAPKSSTGWAANIYTIGGNWEAMETAGAVFLPAAGYREGSIVRDVGDYGYYWSSTAFDEFSAYYVYFISSHVFPDNRDDRLIGSSVRLIAESK